MVAAVVVGSVGSIAVGPAASAATGTVARPAPAAHRPARPGQVLQPLAAEAFLARQRAGYGTPAQASARFQRALVQSHLLLRRRLVSASQPTADFTSPVWQPLGPSSITGSFYGGTNSGRVTSVAVAQTAGVNGDTTQGEIFVGAAGGGVWTSQNGGSTWTSHTDSVSTGLAIGALALDPNNPSVVYAGTGEQDQCADCFYGGGVLKSTDGGSTWTVQNPVVNGTGMFTGADFSSLVVDPHNSQDVYAGTSRGLYESQDGGTSWSLLASGAGWGLVTSVVLDPATVPSTLYTAVAGFGIFQSQDGGSSFQQLANGLPPAADFRGAKLAVGTSSSAYPGGNHYVYASVATPIGFNPNQGGVTVFASTDSGASWTEEASAPAYTSSDYAYGGVSVQSSSAVDQDTYDNAITVDPADPLRVIAAGMIPVETTNGGATWNNLNGQPFGQAGRIPNYLHPDFHTLAFGPDGSLFLGCDGGAFALSAAGVASPGALSGSDYRNLNAGLPITQFFTGASRDGQLVLAGAQDNGTSLTTGSSNWAQQLSGDGGMSYLNPADTSEQLAEADGRLYLTTDGWQNTLTDITPPAPGYPTNFVPPIAAVPNAASVMEPSVYFGGANLFVTRNPGASAPTWTQLTTVGGGVSAIAVAPSNPNVVYVGFDNGRVLMSQDATAASPSFTDVSPPNNPFWITHIEVDPANSARIALTMSNSDVRASAIAPMVETATISGQGSSATAAYTDVTGNLPNQVASDSVVFDQGSTLVATDVGVFVTAALNGSSTQWTPAGGGLPNVQVMGLSVAGDGTVLALTHGRGAWVLAPAAATGYSLAVTQGTPQTATVGTAFSTPLTVRVTNSSGAAVGGVSVSFTAPMAGATAALSAPSVVTGSTGTASVTATAGTVSGSFLVTAALSGAPSVTFSLTDRPGSAAQLSVAGGNNQQAPVGTTFSAPLAVLVADRYGNAVPVSTVTFTAPASGASANLSGSPATSASNGIAQVTAVAGSVTGSYQVTAVDAAASTVFSLTNGTASSSPSGGGSTGGSGTGTSGGSTGGSGTGTTGGSATVSSAAVDPVSSFRLLDTRSAAGPVQPGQPVTVRVAGVGGVPADASGVFLTVTAVQPTGDGNVRLFGAGGPVPAASAVNLLPGETVSDTVLVPIGAGGSIEAEVFGTASQLLLDAVGYVPAGSPTVVGPARLFDSRTGTAGGPVPVRTVRTVQVAGVAGIPAGAAGAIVTVTAVQPAGAGNIRVYPDGSAVPATSAVNLLPGHTIADTVVVPLGADGRLDLELFGSASNVTLDITGYLASSGQGLVAADRLLDTRTAGGPVAPGHLVTLGVAGVDGVPSTARAAIVTITAVQASGPGNVRAFAAGAAVPGTSAVSLLPGSDVADTTVVPLGTGGRIQLEVFGSATGLAVDLVGYLP